MIINPSAYEKLDFFATHSDRFSIISDFDATLNSLYDEKGERTQGVVALLHKHNTLSERYTHLAQQQFEKYEPLEQNITLDFAQRLEAMIARWTENIEALVDEKLNYNILKQTIELGKIHMRPGSDTLINFAEENNIPFVIFSASSIGRDAIDLALQYRGIHFDLDFIVANRMKRNDRGYLVGFDGPLIHSLNKTESMIWSDPHYSTIQKSIIERPHAIVIGDQIHDAYMIDESKDRVVLRIGLHNNSSDGKREEFLEHFDIVITDDGDFHALNTLLYQYFNNKDRLYHSPQKTHHIRS